jgi:hypothetical protein
MKRIELLLLVFFLIFHETVVCQDTLSERKVSASVDVYSQHVWRGFANGTSVSIQPSIDYTHNNFTGGAWGAWCIDGSYFELDLFLSYKMGNFTGTVYDYFCPVNPVEKFEFFEIGKGKTKHTFDFHLEYANPGKHPFSLLVATMLYGDDINPATGNSFYSTYIEPAAGFNLGKAHLKLFAGFTPGKSYYAEQAAIVNTGISAGRNIRIIKKVQIPVKVSFAHNPYQHKSYLTFGINLRV